ncbi:MAG: DUF3786 domain-containing protein [Proteobacteria bacterium]|nr:DUF3786 domain-containing protein [Pseudomonadota bacterium]MBU1388250.1 DUF3786 domain-containing protein [Pseudomonadota bacterium]MBU1541861.1 DUF3786 domain-containing protein [Pseudomonadota bacterium]MBU2429413.1 DUF3786 domain-containing protein [Pseudomonadota bacterium]MBU2479618.1 DUF3786 domain-containing protein [Pseudomonadota bacterium]
MSQTSDIFEKHYDDYRAQVAKVDFLSVKDRLGIEVKEDQAIIRFADEIYTVSGARITDASGNRPGYAICVVLFKYILLCPDPAPYDINWVALTEFKQTGQFTNVNFFASETEGLLKESFSGRLEAFVRACKKMGATQSKLQMPWDLAMEMDVLPKIKILVLFNDTDEEFPALCKVLFQKHAQFYLDPESMIIATSVMAKKLVNLGCG